MRKLRVAVLALLYAPSALAHHVAGGLTGATIFEAFLAGVLLATPVLYAVGVRTLWRKAGPGRGIRFADTLCFSLGWLALAAALLSPIDEVADRSFALHMVQHELLMIVAAPLLVLGKPVEAWAWALPMRAAGVAAVMRNSTVRTAWRFVTAPFAAWALHAAALWIWHVPLLFKAALTSLPLHLLQHSCFLASALGFWWAALGLRERKPNGSSIASLFTTMLHTSALGALLTFAPSAWYSLGTEPAFGLSALEDQQLGGLVMWVPGGFAYMVAGLFIVGRWLSPNARTSENSLPRQPSHVAVLRSRGAASSRVAVRALD